MQNKVEKIQANKLAPDIIGGIIESIEEKPLKNLNWIDFINIDNKNNHWIVNIKSKASYYPDIILKSNKVTKSKKFEGKLYEIEEQLLKIKELYKPSL